MTHEQMRIIEDFASLLTRQIDKINKKNDITPDELMRMDKAFDILKDIQIMCAMDEYQTNPEEEMYSSMGYYGQNSRMNYRTMPHYSRNSGRGYSRDEAAFKMRSELEEKLNNTTDDRERELIMKCLRAIDN